jgi:hypothetical protein
MDSIHCPPPASKPRPHDPLVCGLDPATDCDKCRAHAERAEHAFLERDADAKERARRRDIARRFVDSTGISLDELADALLPHQAEAMADIAAAVADEREAA